jgi:hypothetical protein
VQLQLLAAATAINLKRLLSAHDAAPGRHAGEPGARATQIPWLTSLLIRVLTEIDRLATADSSTGS